MDLTTNKKCYSYYLKNNYISIANKVGDATLLEDYKAFIIATIEPASKTAAYQRFVEGINRAHNKRSILTYVTNVISAASKYGE